jgi:hypothetical protein
MVRHAPKDNPRRVVTARSRDILGPSSKPEGGFSMATRRHLPPLPRRRSRALVAAALISLVVLAQPATALPGPDPTDAPEEFTLYLLPVDDDFNPFDQLTFQRSAGWDFGDREAYRCAYMERFDAQGNLLFKIEFERSDDYQPGAAINDRGGMESGEGGAPASGDQCGSPAGEGGWQPSGEDHFPHHTHQHLYVDGVELTEGYIDLHRDDCALGYWTPGDEPGEAILWWDEDGPTHTHPGSPMLPCNGGEQEPSAVARMMVIPVAANTGVCTHDDLDGSRCTGLTAPQPPAPGGGQRSTVGLRLRGHLRAFGFVNAPGGGGICLGARTVRVDRRESGHWHTLATDLTSATGFYSVRLGDRPGMYRTRVVGTTLATGEVCQTAVSPKRHHR